MREGGRDQGESPGDNEKGAADKGCRHEANQTA